MRNHNGEVHGNNRMRNQLGAVHLIFRGGGGAWIFDPGQDFYFFADPLYLIQAFATT